MKIIHLILVFFLLTACSEKEKIEIINELPSELMLLRPPIDFLDSLNIHFPVGKDIKMEKPELFTSTTQKNIVLIKESEIFVRFIGEETSLKNSLCWYSYHKSTQPSDINQINKYILFPNISGKGEGGLLECGHTLKIGSEKHPAGTVIGFCLIQNGWNDGLINYCNESFYTNITLNLRNNQQHILFKQNHFKYLLIGFEDGIIDDEHCDRDCNDIIFEVTDNIEGYEATSIDLSKIIIL